MTNQLGPGLTPEDAVDAFEAACNAGPDCLVLHQGWFTTLKWRLLETLPSELTQELEEALREAVYKRRRLYAVVKFVELQPMTWEEFEIWEAEREQDRIEQARSGFFPWKDVDASANNSELQLAHPPPTDTLDATSTCPNCGRGSSELTRIYFSSPAWTWEHRCGRAGWLVLCESCHMQVDFTLELMN